jgi:hypothetical protein
MCTQREANPSADPAPRPREQENLLWNPLERQRRGRGGEPPAQEMRISPQCLGPLEPQLYLPVSTLGKSSTIHFSLRLSPETRVEFFHSQATEVASIGTHIIYAQHI